MSAEELPQADEAELYDVGDDVEVVPMGEAVTGDDWEPGIVTDVVRIKLANGRRCYVYFVIRADEDEPLPYGAGEMRPVPEMDESVDLSPESGQALAEYAVVIACVALFVIGLLAIVLAPAITHAFTSLHDFLHSIGY